MSSLLRMLIAMVAILSLAMGLVAHAAEPTMAAETVCVETGHAEPAETAPGEGPEQHGLHAHGGCHGHHQVDAFGPAQWLADALSAVFPLRPCTIFLRNRRPTRTCALLSPEPAAPPLTSGRLDLARSG